MERPYLALVWLVGATAIVIIAFLFLSPEHRSDYFGFRLCWTEVLWAIVWVSLGYDLASAGPGTAAKRLGAITPSIALIAVGYAVFSFTAMMLHAWLPEWKTSDRAHWSVQVALLAIAVAAVSLLHLSRSYAAANRPTPTAEPTPRELHDLLAAREGQLRSPMLASLRADIKRLRETVLYSLSEGEASRSPGVYSELSNGVHQLCDVLSAPPEENVGDWSASCAASAQALMVRTKLASAQRRGR